ncbi:MAG: DUF4837 family protein [Bacteroidales bacterium]|nr:DUF4837 family protein [Bacteroidales bacterium]
MFKASILCMLMLWLLNACSHFGSQGNGLLSSSGHAGEVLIVCSDNQWNSSLGEAVKKTLTQSVLGLPQSEPMFNLSHVAIERFSAVYQKQRNIVYFQIDASKREPQITVSNDKWATPQLIIKVVAPDAQTAVDYFNLNAKAITDRLLQTEFKRFERAYRSKQNFKITQMLEKNYHLQLIVLQEFIVAVQNDEFCWLRMDTKEWTQSFLIYTQDYTDTAQLTMRQIIDRRNELTKKYVFGSIDSSYIVVDEKHIPVESQNVKVGQYFAVRTSGLWETTYPDFMGGAFVNYAFLDTTRQRIVNIDAFLYAPSDKKRDYMRQMEAAIQAVELK